ncbi:M14 family metallopeptidase [Glacieibacterium frigidum]|uniref:Carboxypeptidase n=1 Tax=Glacieibacterium frigidum TaxID=2593303 RepID=A0A552UA67_9SPHN|nr:M14 family metallopeptidase [Glacieibacterium frigidum]TRW15112.1 carboxypeptidase [Glacieibacterium frigidum]
MRLSAIAAALILIAAAPAPLPPELPWRGASEKLIAKPSDPWITPAEAAGFRRTPTYAETRAWLDKLDAASPLIRVEVFGKTPQGRDMLAVIVSKDGATLDPAKPVLLAQGGIHSGEIDGKDAGLMLLRDIALKGKAGLLDRANLVFVPIFNVDGHERSGPFNRPNQRGPENQGWRTTAQNLNLNRDYLKADAPEMRAMIGLIRKYDPALYLDLHVTDGHDEQYDVTISYNGWNGLYAYSPAIGRWLDSRFKPATDAALAKAGHIPGLYVDLIDTKRPAAGVFFNATTPRFSNGYGDLRGMPSVLIETHSLKPYRQRVLGTYVLVEAALKLLGDDAAGVRAAIASDRAARPKSATLAWRPRTEPVATMEWKGIAQDSYQSPASGRAEVRWLGKPQNERVAIFGEEPSITATLPVAWWVPPTAPEIIERLRIHGVQFETLTEARAQDVEMARLVDPKLGKASEGRVPLTTGVTRERRREVWPAGSVRVPADQPLAALAALWLEAESPDGALAWGLVPGILQRTEYIEGYAIAPIADAMLKDPKIKTEFDAKLAADPKFAADGDARLAWFYARTPYYDDRYLLYPVGRE